MLKTQGNLSREHVLGNRYSTNSLSYSDEFQEFPLPWGDISPNKTTLWQNSRMDRKVRIVFLGAGSVEFTQELLCDIFAFEEFKSCEIVLQDINQERLETSVLIAESIAKQFNASPIISSHLDRKSAFVGADYVINSIAVGGLASTMTDFEIPAKYGLNQTIGDTLGIGGIFRALRTFPILKGIAEDMTDICPDAWLLNYTNPMAMNITYLSRIAPKLKVIGLCHSVYWTARHLSELIGVPFEEVTYESAGVNHQAWLFKWELDGKVYIHFWIKKFPKIQNFAVEFA